MTSYFGTVHRILRWPVKSLRGEELREARFDDRGLAGDRAYALVDERENHAGRVLTVRRRAEMLHWRAAYGSPGRGSFEGGSRGNGDFEGGARGNGDAPRPTLTGPDGATWDWDAPGLVDALAESLGTPLSLRAADGQQDRGPTVLVTFEASLVALGGELGRPVDLLRFRPNLHLETDAPAFDEEGWAPGTTITAGETELTVTGDYAGPCIRCVVPSWDPEGHERWPELQKWLIGEHENKFGVIMRVTRAGTARLGDRATATPGPR
ncbi:MOSC N-terminal beta barrel domain-containing protein [Streptosporangium sp. NPDC002524]|uniref:MOSC domain-containing protein n=1 Tax=Streptosporangium sp. NPDC002524 TaxID=3154537 RepID=UPI0033321374